MLSHTYNKTGPHTHIHAYYMIILNWFPPGNGPRDKAGGLGSNTVHTYNEAGCENKDNPNSTALPSKIH